MLSGLEIHLTLTQLQAFMVIDRPSLVLRLLKGSKSSSAKDSEDCEEISEDKENCSDNKKEVVFCFVCLGGRGENENQIMLFLYSLICQFEQLQKKVSQLEEKLDNEMQAKDELEQKCR